MMKNLKELSYFGLKLSTRVKPAIPLTADDRGRRRRGATRERSGARVPGGGKLDRFSWES